MRKTKIAEPVQVKERPEPEGQGDWLYICVSCGYQRKADRTFWGNCPKCGDSRWSAYWLKMPRKTSEKSDNATPDQQNNKGQRCDKTTEPIRRRSGILSPLKCRAEPPKTLKTEGLTPIPGRKETILPLDLINQLASQGLGCRAIADKLLEQGITVSYRTIQRRLQSKERIYAKC